MFRDTEQAAMKQVQEAHMMDYCRILPFVEWDKSSRGESKKVLGAAVESVCGLKMALSDRQGRTNQRFEMIDADAELRLPLGVAVKPKDEIEIIERFGVELGEPMHYEVVKFESSGVSGQRVLLKAVYI
jgi:hypothetical protein